VSPISAEFHATPQFTLTGLFAAYEMHTPGVAGCGPVTILVDDRTLPEPDVVLRLLPTAGGATTLNRQSYIVGPPELLVEVAHTSVARDMGPKFNAYEAGGVAEYLVWRTSRGELELFTLRRGAYSAVAPDAAGVVRSGQFPGLWFDTVALLAGDNRQALETLQLGLASAEHAAFVAKLAARAKRKRK
jgi:Uma2 family endonuclease